eukprot:365991-Chlamydomonas_euryale.AAC.4
MRSHLHVSPCAGGGDACFLSTEKRHNALATRTFEHPHRAQVVETHALYHRKSATMHSQPALLNTHTVRRWWRHVKHWPRTTAAPRCAPQASNAGRRSPSRHT